MRSQKIGFTALITFLATVSTPLTFLKPFTAPQGLLAQTQDATRTEADKLRQQGYTQYDRGQFEPALQSWQQALILYQKIKDTATEGKVLNSIGSAYYSLQNYPKAIAYYQQSLAIAQQIKDNQLETKALSNLGTAYTSAKEYSKAIEYFQQSLAIAKATKNRDGESKLLYSIGDIYKSAREYPKAIDYYNRSLAIALELKNRERERDILNDLGETYISLREYSKAIEYHEQSLAIARELKKPDLEKYTLNRLGIAYYYLRNYSKAIDFYQQGLAIARAINDRAGEGIALANLGQVNRAFGKYAEALKFFEQSVTIAREIKNGGEEAATLNDLGLLYQDLADENKALEYYQQVLKLAQELKDRPLEGRAFGNIGVVGVNLGDYEKAIPYFEQSLAIARELKDPFEEAATLNNLCSTSERLGDNAKAINYCEQSLALSRQLKDGRLELYNLNALGLAYSARGDFKRAMESYQQSLAIAKALGERDGEASALNNAGLVFLQTGKFAEATETLRASIKVKESLREGLSDANKVSIFEDQARTYRLLQEALIAQNKTDDALEIAERGKARAFVELLARRVATSNSELTISPPTIEQIKQIARSQNATLIEYSIIYGEFKVAGKEQVRESELYVWVIQPNGKVAFRRVDLKPLWQKQNTSLSELVTSSRESIGVRGRGLTVVGKDENKDSDRLKQLHQLLIQPIADQLPEDPSDRVIFIPQAGLFLVPFPALQDSAGKYLIEQHTILTSPSIQVLDLTHKQRRNVSGTDVLVVGNPTMPSISFKLGEPPEQLPSLPGAEAEAKAIAQLLNTKAIVGKDATKVAFLQQLPKAKIIHLATHGLLDDFKGLGVPGAVALAPSGSDNGLLTASEILDLKFNAELVVLSACDTGRGKITGDGVIGLSRSLISAGTPSVIVSLWSVPDAPTVSLMTEFYRHLQLKPDKAQALRSAMLTTMQQTPSPKDWAAFTLIGEAE